jgi:hypothetical protein
MELEKIVKKAGVKVYDDLTYDELRGIIYKKIEDITRIASILAEYTRDDFVDKNLMEISISQYNLPCKSKIKDLSISQDEFKNKAVEKLDDYSERLKFKGDSVITLQKAVECYVIDLLKIASKEAKKRTDTDEIEPKDLNTARRVFDGCNF